MREYTFLCSISILLVLFLDNYLKINILKKKIFYLFLLIIFIFKLVVNGYLTARHIVLYSQEAFLGIRLGSIPLEDFLFGFSMVSLTIIFWEFFKRKDAGYVKK
ncbi:MAG: lycopene cyclase domain-containing protein [Candidatus Omnitrophica bacterium]|jgi:lycopene cyclase domain-containing protein|nr:lycopene cyclase domain-containing protein [Candidatus Omnitrophota bacterium]